MKEIQNKMVITRAISHRILVISSIISLLLIAGSIYLHLQQKPHLGRMNSSARNMKSDEGQVEESPVRDDSIGQHVSSPSVVQQSNISDGNSNDLPSQDEDYLNDDIHKTNSNEELSKALKAIHKSSTSKYTSINDNNDGTDLNVEYDDNISKNIHLNATDTMGLTEHCFHCLCMTVNECKPFKCAHIYPCGIYGISKYYWMDGNSPKTAENTDYDYGEVDQTYIDYLQCVNNDNCAMETVRNYIKRYQRDCNNDGVIDCHDHIALHLLGPTGCKTKNLTPLRKVRMLACLKH